MTEAERRALELLMAGAGLEEIRAALGVGTALEAWERLREMVPDIGPIAAALYLLCADLDAAGFEGMSIEEPGGPA